MQLRLREISGIVLLLLAFAPAHAKAKRARLYDCTGKLTTAMAKYKKSRYAEVRTILEEVKVQCSGHSAMDTVLYYLGMSFLKDKKPDEAKMEFNQLIRDFPNSAFHEEAQFRLGHCSLAGSNAFDRDQSGTQEAMRELTGFLDGYSDSRFADSARAYLEEAREKLAKKQIMNARFYEKIEEREAAIVYYRVFVSEYPDSKYVPDAKLAMAENLIKVNRTSEAREVLDQLVEAGYSKEVTQRAQLLKTSVGQSE